MLGTQSDNDRAQQLLNFMSMHQGP